MIETPKARWTPEEQAAIEANRAELTPQSLLKDIRLLKLELQELRALLL